MRSSEYDHSFPLILCYVKRAVGCVTYALSLLCFLDFTKITAPCYFTLQLHCSSSRVGKQSSACSRLWCLLVADSQSRPNYSWEYEKEEIGDTLDKASFPACDLEAGMERAWEGIINVHKWHLKNAVLNYHNAVVVWRRKLWSAHLPFFGNTFHLWLSHVIAAWAAAARCLFSLPLPLLPPAGILAEKYSHAFKGNGFLCCIYCFVRFSLSSPRPSDVLVHTKTLNERQ